MKISKPLFWLITILWFLAGLFWYRSCSDCHSCDESVITETKASEVALPGFTVSDGEWSVHSPTNLRFGHSSEVPVLSREMPDILDQITAHARSNPDKLITVTGYYSSTETNNTPFDNLGIARAETIKMRLVSAGIDPKNIMTQGQLSDKLVFHPQDTLVGGIGMEFGEMLSESSGSDIADLFEPRTLYFNTAQSALPMDNDFSNYIQKVKTYLDNHSDKNLMITGHTDNVGAEAMNMQLSLHRANSVKSQLSNKGISAHRIKTEGKGPREPITSNNTEDGRAKNRRVTIQLQ